nr:MAG TPA: hypothetical protein [Caudoviricetes sp.]
MLGDYNRSNLALLPFWIILLSKLLGDYNWCYNVA